MSLEQVYLNIYEQIMEAQREAIKRGIVANSILINENMCEIKPHTHLFNFDSTVSLPPMICGMNVYFTKNDLPDNYSFALFEGRPNRLDQFESIGMEPDELRKAAELYRKVKEMM